MCYTNGPRCGTEAMKMLQKAEASGNVSKIAEARHEYNLTNEGIRELRDSGQIQKANQYQSMRDQKIVVSKKISTERKNQMGRFERFKEWASKNRDTVECRKGTWSNESKTSFKTRRRKVAAVAGVGFLSVSLLTGCSVNNQADYAAACKDAKTNVRVSDDKCSDKGGSSGVYGWYYVPMGSHVAPVGSPMSGGTSQIGDNVTRKAGVDAKGATVTSDGFGKKGATTKSGFGSGGAKGGGRGGGHGG